MNLAWRNQVKGLLFISPWLIGVCVFTLLPVALSLYYSFCDFPLLQKPVWIGMDNYRDMAHDPVFWKSLRNTFYFAAVTLPSGMVMSLLMAMLLNTKTWGLNYYRTIIFLPVLVPIVASALLWMALLNPNTGPISNFVRFVFRTDPPDWLGQNWVIPTFGFMGLWSVGYTITIYLAALQDVPRELYEAAELDGAGAIRRMWNVTLPTISPVIFFNLIIGIIGSMQVFAMPFVMTGRGVANSTYMYSMKLYDEAFTYLNMGYASAMAWVQLLIVLALTGIAFWSSKRWVHYQGK